jgi:glutamate synthase domain-containing protein 3
MSALVDDTSSADVLTIEAADRPLRELNREIREAVSAGLRVEVSEPLSRHNLAVGLTGDGTVVFRGSVGYYCGGLSAGGTIEVHGNSGWGTGEGLSAGHITIRGNAGMSVGAAMRGGTIHVRGNAGPRCGVAQKAGNIVVEGDIGYSTGFMSHGGRIVCLGNSTGSVGDSLWEGEVWVAGEIERLGIDAKAVSPEAGEVAEVDELLTSLGVDGSGLDWKKVVAEQKLWYFEARDAKQWLMI